MEHIPLSQSLIQSKARILSSVKAEAGGEAAEGKSAASGARLVGFREAAVSMT